MRFSLPLAVLPLAISVGAMTVTEPEKGALIASGSSVDVKWTSVDTDASSFDIYLVNNAVYPTVNKKLASNIATSKDSESVSVGNIPAGHGYQINLVSDDPKNTGILAQTGQFNVTGSAESSTTSASVTSTSTSSSSASSGTSTGHSTSGVSTTSLTSHNSSSSTGSSASMTTSQFVSTSTGVSTTAVITGEVTKTASSGMQTSASASGSAATTTAPSGNAGAAILAHPAVALGVVGGALAFML